MTTKHRSLGSAVKAQDVDGLQELLSMAKFESEKLRLETLNSLLVHAASMPSVKITEILLEKGADPSFSLSKGKKIQHIAAETGNMEMLSMLQKRGISLNARDSDGATPLHYLLKLEEELPEDDPSEPASAQPSPSGPNTNNTKTVKSMSETIMGMNVDMNLGDLEGRRPLHYAVLRLKNCVTKKQQEEGKGIIMEMLSEGADPGQADSYNSIPAEYLPEGDGYNDLFNHMEELRETQKLAALSQNEVKSKSLRI